MFLLLILLSATSSYASNYSDIKDLLAKTLFTPFLSEAEIYVTANQSIAEVCEGVPDDKIINGFLHVVQKAFSGMLPKVQKVMSGQRQIQFISQGSNLLTCLMFGGSSMNKMLMQTKDVLKKSPLGNVVDKMRKMSSSLKKSYGSCSAPGAVEEMYGVVLNTINPGVIKKIWKDMASYKKEYSCVKKYFRDVLRFI